ncbi:MAG TPA: hypothetical protein VFD58_14525 [Blastocatellia bacterium]|nr:hypothetical protein [Blastocatellia bacterium]
MEREQELKKLINVLHRTARAAGRVQWMNAGESEARFAVSQYNRILARLGELDPDVKNVFVPLAEDSSLLTVAMACRQVVSYYEDEVRTEQGWGFEGGPAFGFGAAGCGKDFDFENIGNLIRDRLQEAMREWKRREREWRRSGRHDSEHRRA